MSPWLEAWKAVRTAVGWAIGPSSEVTRATVKASEQLVPRQVDGLSADFIAASPDLYRALDRLVTWTGGCRCNVVLDIRDPRGCPHQQAWAALRAARGQEAPRPSCGEDNSAFLDRAIREAAEGCVVVIEWQDPVDTSPATAMTRSPEKLRRLLAADAEHKIRAVLEQVTTGDHLEKSLAIRAVSVADGASQVRDALETAYKDGSRATARIRIDLVTPKGA